MSITVNVVGKPSKIVIEPSVGVARAGQRVQLKARLLSAEGDEILLGVASGYKIVFHCIDPSVGVFYDGPVATHPDAACRRDASLNTTDVGGITGGLARFEAFVEKFDSKSTLVLPDIRATIVLGFTRPAVRLAFDEPLVTVRVQEAVPLRYHLYDVDNNKLPSQDLKLSFGDADSRGFGSSLQELANSVANQFVVKPYTILGRSELTISVSTATRESVSYSFEGLANLPLQTATMTVRVLPRVSGFLGLPSVINMIEGEDHDVVVVPIYVFGAPTTPKPQIVYNTSSVATVGLTGLLFGTGDGITLHAQSAGSTGAASSVITVKVAPEEGSASQQITVNVTRRTTLTAISLVTRPRNEIGAVAINRGREYELLDQSGINIPPAAIIYSVTNVAPATGPAIATLTATSLGTAAFCQLPGTVLITAKPTGTTLQATATQICGTSVVGIIDEPLNKQLNPGGTHTYRAQVRDAAGVVIPTAVVTWDSSDPTVASINATTGLATATTKLGAVTITASSASATPASTPLTVVAPTPPPRIVFTPSPVIASVAGSTQTAATVTNPIPGGTLTSFMRDPTLAEYSQSTNSGSSSRGSIGGKGIGSSYLITTYTAGNVVIVDSVLVTVPSPTPSRVARLIIEPRDQVVTAPVGFTYRLRFLDALGNATTPETAAEGGEIRYFNNNDAVATITKNTDPTTAQEVSKTAGLTDLTVLYTRNGQNIAVDNTSLTVRAAGTAGNYGSLTISTAGDVRVVRMGANVAFQVLVRDVNNVIQTTGVNGLNVSPSDLTVMTTDRDLSNTSGYFYTIRGIKPGLVTINAVVQGAATSIVFLVTP